MSTAAFLLYIAVAAPLAALAIERRLSPTSLGAGALTVMFALPAGLLALTLLHIPWTVLAITALACVIVATAALLARGTTPWSSRPTVTMLEFACAAAAALILAGFIFWATSGPAWEWDFWMIWGAKGRAFHAAGGLDFAFLTDPFHAHVRPRYPPLLPTLMAAAATLDGGWRDDAFGIFYVVAGLAAALVIYGELRSATTPPRAAAGGLLALTGCLTPQIGLADGLLTACLTAAVLLARRVLANGSVRESIACGLLLGFCTLLKDEGLAAAAVVTALFAFGIRRQTERRVLLAGSGVPAIILALLWILPRLWYPLGGYGLRPEPMAEVLAPARLRELGSALVSFFPDSWPVWVALAATLLVVRPILSGERLVITAIFLQAVIYVSTYIFIARGHRWDPNWYDLTWHVRASWPRLVGHLTPLATFVTLVLVLPLLPRLTVPASRRRNLSTAVSLNAEGENT